MKYIIKHESQGRIRLRCGKFAFSEKEGFGIVERLRKEKFIIDVITSHENGGILIIYQKGNRKEVLNFLDSIEKYSLICCEPSDRDLIRVIDRDFQQKLAYKLAKRTVFKLFIPSPVLAVFTVCKAIPYILEGISNMLKFNINVAVLDGAAICASLVQGEYSSSGSIMFLLSLSSMMEDYTRKRTKNALLQSLAVNVDRVWLVTDEGEISIPMSKVVLGDKIKIRTGGMIPVDGTVVGGEALVNESTMTGEPLSVLKQEGATVYAGTVVEEGGIVVEITALSAETRINKIISMIDQSESLKADVHSKAEKLADSIVPFSFMTSIGIYLFTRNITKALSVLMVDYSCAIKLSVPISVISAMREASNHLIMIKGGKYLESYAFADTIVFDKTGTLTEACPTVAKVIPLGKNNREEILRTAACLEEHFPHSVAKAIVKQAHNEGLNHEEEHAEVEYVVAHGISSYLGDKKAVIGSAHFVLEDEKIHVTQAQQKKIDENINGYSAIYLAVGGKLIGVICINDPVRKEAKAVISQLKKLGVKNVIMLTGDSDGAARVACEDLGISEYRAQVLPADKAKTIEEIKAKGRQVIMVGDGINDSPALSSANVSVAMKDSSDIAKEVADITLLSAELNELVTLRLLSKKLFERINGNYKFILTFNTALLALGIGGIITPQTSALCHNMSTMAISAVSMRPCLKNE